MVMRLFHISPLEIGRVSLLQARELMSSLTYGSEDPDHKSGSKPDMVKSDGGSGIVLDELYEIVKKRMEEEPNPTNGMSNKPQP